MKSIQANNRIIPRINNGATLLKPQFLPSYPYIVCFNAKLPVSNSLKLFASTPRCQQQFAPLLKHKRFLSFSKCRPGAAVCKLGGEDKSADNSQGSPWKAIEKAIGNFGKQQSIEDVLRQQMEKEEYYDEGSGKPPGGGGGNGGSGDGSGGSEDEGFFGILDETLQVILATIGFILVYVYIISGEELGRLAKDYIKFLFGGNKSVRLKRAMNKWRRFFENLKEKKESDELWLEKAIITTPTWLCHPCCYDMLLEHLVFNLLVKALSKPAQALNHPYEGGL
ncbi:hypothetical protein COLO4_19851 [Corchorus olitorius]|uniref:Glycine-rich protein n=1 Tax=Corchorus olitorius TaxID=93759 RepID=A0A1R3J2Z0_9ROSI|nr:hypothetical protein COLO4_19851 [Corchorus olitorius]